jgi:hypothetical protein
MFCSYAPNNIVDIYGMISVVVLQNRGKHNLVLQYNIKMKGKKIPHFRGVMVFNTISNNISVISWRLTLSEHFHNP